MPDFITLAHPNRFRSVRPMPRDARRRLVVAMYAAFAAFLAIMYFGYTATPRWPWPLGVLAVAAFLATGYGFVRLVYAPGYAADTVDRFLDERQRLVRDQAYRAAYYPVTALLLVLSLVVMYAAGGDASWSALRDLAPFVPWVAFVVGSLPTAIVAWSEPDPPEDLLG